MNVFKLIPLLLPLFYVQAFAAEGSIAINSPSNGAIVSAQYKVPVNYEATLGSNGDHLHLYVDGKRVDVLRQIKGSAEFDASPAGKHHICMTENMKSHAPTGVEKCVDVTSQ
jgi:hypothetical protein